MHTFENFKKKYPIQKQTICGSSFPYRYHKNDNSDKTIVLLTGGIGLSDLLVFHFEKLAESYSVLSFDYPISYPAIQQLIDAIAYLLKSHGIKAFLIGQSLGGFIAQILAKQYPDVVDGMILSNTGTLSVNMDEQGKQCLNDMMKQMNKSLLMIKMLPFGIVKKSIKRAVLKKVSQQLDVQEQAIMSEICDEMVQTLTKDYEIHMTLLMTDLQNYWDMESNHFEQYKGKVLLILSDDDFTFNDNVKQALINVMPNPQVITDIRGGHLALLLKVDKYIAVIKSFIDRAT